MAPRRAGWIDWRNSRAKQVILEDLERYFLPLEEEDMSTEDAWTYVYQGMPEFEFVQFSQFQARLKDHRKQVKKRQVAASRQQHDFVRDRQLHPRRTHDRNGRLLFDASAASALLRDDVADDRHLTMDSETLRKSRTAYHPFEPTEFRRRIYQEVRRQKFIYYLAWKRAKKQQQRGMPDDIEEESEEESVG